MSFTFQDLRFTFKLSFFFRFHGLMGYTCRMYIYIYIYIYIYNIYVNIYAYFLVSFEFKKVSIIGTFWFLIAN